MTSQNKREREPLSPLCVIGFEGLLGLVIVGIVVIPLAHTIHGSDNGSLENVHDTWLLLRNSRELQLWVAEMALQLFAFNCIIININHKMGAVAKSMISLLRPGLVWVVQVLMHRLSKGHELGSAWQQWSWLQLGGLVLLLFGTAVLQDLAGARQAVKQCSRPALAGSDLDAWWAVGGSSSSSSSSELAEPLNSPVDDAEHYEDEEHHLPGHGNKGQGQ